MMNQQFVALQGKTFGVSLQSMHGSTNYAWCVADMPKEIIMMGMNEERTSAGISPVIQTFYFGVVSAEHLNVDIHFVLTCLTEPLKAADSFTANVRIVPSDADSFISFSENASKAAVPYGMVYGGENMKYGYPCGVSDAQSPAVKYGYPCGVSDAQNPAVKYGYPCMEATKDSRPYGYPYQDVQYPLFKYGYPGCC